MAARTEVSEVSCPCGASLKINPEETTQEMACPECGQTLEIVVTTDPTTKKSKVGILVKPTAVNPRSGKTKEIHVAKCVCGAQITIEEGRVDSVYTCMICEAEYTATIKKSRPAMSTLVLRPLVASPARNTGKRMKPKAAIVVKSVMPPMTTGAPPPTRSWKSPPITTQTASAGGAAKEKLLLLAKGEVGAQEVSYVGKDQLITCFCGAMILLREGFNREIVKCPVCGKGYRIFLALQPKTSATMAIMIPRG